MAARGSPYPMSEGMRVLGITFDPHIALDEHYGALVSKALARRSILARVAHTKWGLDASGLRDMMPP